MTACPDREQLQRLLGDELDDRESGEISAHVEQCTNCQLALEHLTTGDASRIFAPREEVLSHQADQLSQGSTLGELMNTLRREPPQWAFAGEQLDEDVANPASLEFPDPPTPDAPLGRLHHYDILEHLGSGIIGRNGSGHVNVVSL